MVLWWRELLLNQPFNQVSRNPARLLKSRDSSSDALTLTLEPNSWWEGPYGEWTTFEVNVGSPAQTLQLWPSTSQSNIWAVSPDGCPFVTANQSDYCTYDRGYTFPTDASYTYRQIAANVTLDYGLTGNAILSPITAEIGTDTVLISLVNGSATAWPLLANQVIDTFSALYPYNGQLGLAPSFSVLNSTNNTSILEALRDSDTISSLTWGYTNGATYSFSGTQQTLGSLTLGGYDSTRFVPNNVTFPFQNGNLGTLLVAIKAITTDLLINPSTNNSLLSGGIYATIDPLITELWLPLEACYAFESAFNLTWNQTAEMYITNITTSSRLMKSNPNVTISISPTLSSENSVDIIFPYMAFHQRFGPPFLDAWHIVFPLKRASSPTQYVLGRTFFQQAYVIADYERSNFSVYEATFPNTTIIAPNPIAILPPKLSNSSHLRKAAVAGLVIGIVVAVVIFALIFLAVRRKRRSKVKKHSEQEVELSIVPPEAVPVELDAIETQMHELQTSEISSELPTPVAELESSTASNSWNTHWTLPRKRTSYSARLPPPEKSADYSSSGTSSPSEAVPPPYSDSSPGVQNGPAQLPRSDRRRRFSWESDSDDGV